MKSTSAPCVWDLTPPIFHLLVLGVTQILVFLDTNMLVSLTRNCGIGGLSHREDPTRMILRHSGIKALIAFAELKNNG